MAKIKPAYPFTSYGRWDDEQRAKTIAAEQRLDGYETRITKCANQSGGWWWHVLRR